MGKGVWGICYPQYRCIAVVLHGTLDCCATMVQMWYKARLLRRCLMCCMRCAVGSVAAARLCTCSITAHTAHTYCNCLSFGRRYGSSSSGMVCLRYPQIGCSTLPHAGMHKWPMQCCLLDSAGLSMYPLLTLAYAPATALLAPTLHSFLFCHKHHCGGSTMSGLLLPALLVSLSRTCIGVTYPVLLILLTQVLLRWNLQRGVPVIPRASSEEHLRNNIEGAFTCHLNSTQGGSQRLGWGTDIQLQGLW
jgi:hypothetical protein